MIERVSAGSLPTSTRTRVENLTDVEREAAQASGSVTHDGFLDIEKPAPPVFVDLRADARKEAVTKLQSVVGPAATPGAQGVPVAAAETRDVQDLRKEITDLQVQLHSRSPCPRCGLGITESCKTEATPEDIKSFLTSVLAGEGFSKSYTLFGGKLTVEFRTRDGAADELVRKCVTTALRNKDILSETEVFAMMRQLTLAAALKSYRSVDRSIEYPDLPMDSVEVFRATAVDRLNAIPAPVQQFLRPILNDFNELVDLLTSRAQDPDFWPGTLA